MHSVRYNKKPKEKEEETNNEQRYSEDFSNESFLDIPQERKSIRRQVNFYNDEDETDRRFRNHQRLTLCRSRSEQ